MTIKKFRTYIRRVYGVTIKDIETLIGWHNEQMTFEGCNDFAYLEDGLIKIDY